MPGKNLTRKLIESHLVSGKAVAGEEIGLRVDQCLLTDTNGNMAWLQFEAIPRDGGSLLNQTAYFAPRGLAGHLYWYALYPVHAAIFRNLVRRVAERAQTLGPLAAPQALP